MQYALGIDPGLSGACVLITGPLRRPRIKFVLDIPVIEDGTQRYVSARTLMRDLRQLSSFVKVATIEGVQAMRSYRPAGDYQKDGGDKEGWGASVNFKLGRAVGAIESVVDCAGLSVVRVAPVTWKRHFELIKQDKEASRQLALKLFGPHESLDRKKDHGRAEAALMALWSMQVMAAEAA